MIVDKYSLVVLEQCGFPGNVGDSAAETFRYILLSSFVGQLTPVPEIERALENTQTNIGYLRHPESPWTENDFSCDQWLPRLLGADKSTSQIGMLLRLWKSNYRTGNGDLISPIAYAASRRIFAGKGTKFDFALYLQTLVFKIPFRWSDSKHWFESSAGSSADYLNWFMYLIFCEANGPSFWSRRARAAMNPDVLRAKVRAYYANEPNCFVLPLYDAAIDKVWSKKYD